MRKLPLAIAAIVLLLGVCSAFSPNEEKGGVEVVEMASALLPKTMNVNVVVPTEYMVDTAVRYPVVYLLNGHGGNNTSWGTIVALDSVADVHKVIIVCPDGMNSWYFDSPVRPEMKMESFITGELVPFVDSCYRTLARPESRAITGYSMGGHGALWLAMRHPDMFGTAGSMSGGVDFTPWPGSWNLKDALGPREENTERWRNHTVASLVAGLNPGDLNIIFDCGTEDFFYDVNCALDSALNSRHIPHVYRTSPGAHNREYWAGAIGPQLEYFATMLER